MTELRFGVLGAADAVANMTVVDEVYRAPGLPLRTPWAPA